MEPRPLFRAQPCAWTVLDQPVAHVEQEMPLPFGKAAANKCSLDARP